MVCSLPKGDPEFGLEDVIPAVTTGGRSSLEEGGEKFDKDDAVDNKRPSMGTNGILDPNK
jgi:hypothetical protein